MKLEVCRQSRAGAIATVRPFAPTDTETAIRVWKAACAKSHAFLPRPFMRETERFLRSRLGETNAFVFDDGAVRGFACVANGVIDALFVDPSHQRQGIGKRLLRHAKGIAETLTLGVFTENTEGILFYHREGFLVVKRWFYPAAGSEMLVMRWTRGGEEKA